MKYIKVDLPPQLHLIRDEQITLYPTNEELIFWRDDYIWYCSDGVWEKYVATHDEEIVRVYQNPNKIIWMEITCAT